jgi:hypothetical protein
MKGNAELRSNVRDLCDFEKCLRLTINYSSHTSTSVAYCETDAFKGSERHVEGGALLREGCSIDWGRADDCRIGVVRHPLALTRFTVMEIGQGTEG